MNLFIPAREIILASSAVQLSHTGNTNETTLATITIPAGTMGANDMIEVTTLWSFTNNANVKTPRVRLGGVSGTAFYGPGPASNVQIYSQIRIRNRGVQNSQLGYSASAQTSYSASAGALVTSAIDMGSAQDLVFSGQLANSADTISLESYDVSIKRRSAG